MGIDPAGDGAGYALGVLLDRDGEGMGGIADRFVFRPGILRAFGWRVLDLPVSRWLRDPAGVVAQIEDELVRDSWQDLEEDLFDGEEIAPPAPSPAPVPVLTIVPATAPDPSAQGRAPPAGMKEFRFQQGGSSKFWRIGVEGCDVTVVFGRIGSKGQSVIKTFAHARTGPGRSRQADLGEDAQGLSAGGLNVLWATRANRITTARTPPNSSRRAAAVSVASRFSALPRRSP